MNQQRIITVLNRAYRNYIKKRNTPKPLGRWNTLDNSMIKADLATMDSCCCNSASKLNKTKDFQTVASVSKLDNKNINTKKTSK